MLINSPELQHLPYKIKDQLRSYPRLDLLETLNQIFRIINFLKLSHLILTDTLFVKLNIP